MNLPDYHGQTPINGSALLGEFLGGREHGSASHLNFPRRELVTEARDDGTKVRTSADPPLRFRNVRTAPHS